MKKNKIDLNKVKTAAVTVGTYAGTFSVMAVPYVVSAASTAQNLMGSAIDLIAKVIIALAVMYLVMGIVKYASAHADGDGPAEGKARNQIAAGVMVALVSAVLLAMKDQLASLISL